MTMSRLSGASESRIIEELINWDRKLLCSTSAFPRNAAKAIAIKIFRTKGRISEQKILQIRDFITKNKKIIQKKIETHDFSPLHSLGPGVDQLHNFVPKAQVEKDEPEEISQREEGPGAAGDEDDEDDEDDNDEAERSSTSSIEIVMETEEDRARFEYMKERVLKGPDPLNTWVSDPQQRRMAGKRRLSKLSKLSDEEDNNMYKKSRKN